MPGSLQPYFDLYQFPTGRRLFALRQVKERAEQMSLATIAELADEAVQHDEQTMHMEAAWRRARSINEGKREAANVIDVALDRAVGGLHTHLQSLRHAFGDAHPRGKRAAQVLDTLFPEGAGAITTMTYENELAAVEVLLHQLNDDFAAEKQDLNLAPYMELITELKDRFALALKDEQTRDVTYSEIRHARMLGQEGLLRVVAKVLGEYCGPSEEHVTMRHTLLAPVMSQNRRLEERYASRRGSGDVDPQTGNELDDEVIADPLDANSDQSANAMAAASATGEPVN